MRDITAGQSSISELVGLDARYPLGYALDVRHPVIEAAVEVDAAELSNVQLLEQAMDDALNARQAGVLGGPNVLGPGSQFETYYQALATAAQVDAAEERAASELAALRAGYALSAAVTDVLDGVAA